MSTQLSADDWRKICLLKACDNWILDGVGNKGTYILAPTGYNINLFGTPLRYERNCYDLFDGKEGRLYTEDCQGNMKLVDRKDWTFDCCPEHNK